jgi:hypothetical protein
MNGFTLDDQYTTLGDDVRTTIHVDRGFATGSMHLIDDDVVAGAIVGGAGNTLTDDVSFTSGVLTVTGARSAAILGGELNFAEGHSSYVLGGSYNRTYGSYAGVAGQGNYGASAGSLTWGWWADTPTTGTQFGIVDFGELAWAVGNGAEGARSNAVEMDWYGNVTFSGAVTATGVVLTTGSLELGALDPDAIVFVNGAGELDANASTLYWDQTTLNAGNVGTTVSLQAYGNIVAVGDEANLIAFGAGADIWRADSNPGRVTYWDGPAFIGARIVDSEHFLYDNATRTLTVENLVTTGTITGTPSFGLNAGEVLFGGASGEIAQDAAFTFDAAGDDLTVGDDVSAGGLLSSDLTAGRVAIVGTAGRLADDAGLTFDPVDNDLTVGDDTFIGGRSTIGEDLQVATYLDVGSSAPVLAAGDFVAGSVLANMRFDESDGDLTVTDDVFAAGFLSSDLTPTHMLHAGVNGRISGDAGFVYDAATDTGTITNLTVTGTLTGGSGVSGLTPNLVLFGKSDGTIEQDAGLSYALAGDDLTVTGADASVRISDGAFGRATIDATGTLELSNSAGSPVVSLGPTGENVINMTASARDFRVASDTNANMLYVDGTNDRVGINDSTPDAVLDIGGSESLQFVPAGETNMFVVSAPDGGLVLEAASSKVELDGTFLVFEEADVEVSRFDTAGRFKIGTTAAVTDADFGLMGDVGAAAAETYQYWWNDTTTAATLSGLRVGIDASEAATINHYENTSLKVSVGSTLVDFATFDVSTTPDEARFNEDGADLDFYVEGDTRDAIQVDASTDRLYVPARVSLASATTATIASGSLTPVSSNVIAAAESGVADDLDFIAGTPVDGDVIVLQADSGDTITIRNNQTPGTGKKFQIGGNIVLSLVQQVATFKFSSAADAWQLVSLGTTQDATAGVLLPPQYYVKKTSDETFTSSTPSNVASLSFTVKSGVYYKFEFGIIRQSDNILTGARFAITTPTFTRYAATARDMIAADGASAEFQATLNSSGDAMVGPSVQAANADAFSKIEGIIVPSADGTLQLQAGREGASDTITVRQGSYGILTPLN